MNNDLINDTQDTEGKIKILNISWMWGGREGKRERRGALEGGGEG